MLPVDPIDGVIDRRMHDRKAARRMDGSGLRARRASTGMNARDLDAAAREIAGSARSMGLEVVE